MGTPLTFLQYNLVITILTPKWVCIKEVRDLFYCALSILDSWFQFRLVLSSLTVYNNITPVECFI